MIHGTLRRPRKLEESDDRSGFHSGAKELDEWFQKYAWQNQRANNATTYVVTLDAIVLGYYAICAAGVSQELVPASFGRRRPNDIPCVLLARLAVDARAHGRGIGTAMFRDAIARAVQVSDQIGAACLLIHARDETAKSFYLARADLLQSPVEPMHLMLSLKVAKQHG